MARWNGPNNVSICFVFSRRVRRYVHYLVTSSAFRTLVIITVCASSITLAAEDPIHSNSTGNVVLGYFDNAFTVLFAAEMLLKVQIFIRSDRNPP